MTAAILADFRTDPYLHQLVEFELSADLEARAWIWQMRTGKTKIAIDTGCHQYKTRKIDAVLIFAPNGIHENWTRRQIPLHHWPSVPYESIVWHTSVAGDRSPQVLTLMSNPARTAWQVEHDLWWTKFKTMLQAKDGLQWFAFASETMTRPEVRRAVARILRRRRVLVQFDESHDFRKPGSKRSSMARALSKRCVSRRILTATPVTNSPLHSWSQYELLQPSALGFSRYSDFDDHFAVYESKRTRSGRRYAELKEYRDLDSLQDRLAVWSSVVLRGDCEDLPDVIRTARRVELSDEQLRVYRELHESFEVELSDGRRLSIGERSSRFAKLQQVTSGFLYDEYGELHRLPGPNPRLEAVSDEVYLCPGKIVVWCRFRPDMDLVADRLLADGHEVVQYHGRISDAEKNVSIDRFQNDPDVKVLVGYPMLGHDLSAAVQIVWYSHTFDAIVRLQADERATEVGGSNVELTDLVVEGPDEYILSHVADNVDVADSLVGRGFKNALERISI